MVCDSAGHCTCKPNIQGYKCDECAANQYGFPNCQGNIFIHFVQFAKAPNSPVPPVP